MVSSGASAAAVVGAVEGNPKLASRVYLERIVTIVNATSMLCPGSLAHEQSVVAQCAPGLVSSIVLVNIEAVADQVDDMQQRLRCVNPLAVVICAVAGRVTAARDMESLFLLDEGEEPWFDRDKVCSMREQLFTSCFFSRQLHAEDVWSSRRGVMTQIGFALPNEAVFIRPALVRALRSLFVSPRGLVLVVWRLALASACCAAERPLW